MRYYFIMNRQSNGGKSKRKIKRILSLINEAGVNYKYALIDTLQEAYERSVLANNAGYDRIIAVGGDGTINNVINGFYNTDGYLISKACFGVVYTGTSPDFCKTYAIPIKVDKAIPLILSANAQQIPIGRMKCSELASNAAQTNKVKYFACCANIGIGASIARSANSGMRKYLGDFSGTFLSTIICILKYKANSQYAIVDGGQKEFRNNVNLSIGITKYIASGIKVNHDLDNHPNSLYCLEAKNFKLSNIIPTLRGIYSGRKIEASPTLQLSYLKHIDITYNQDNNEVEMDGDPAGFLPCSVELAKESLPLIGVPVN